MNESETRENPNSFLILTRNIRIEVKKEQRKDFQEEQLAKKIFFNFLFVFPQH
jgi:hypothetical protein